MKALIIQINQRMAIEKKAYKYVEVTYAKKFLKEYYNYDVVDIAEKKIKNADNSYLDINKVCFCDYDDLIVIGSPINFFGGIVGEEVYTKIRKVAQFNGRIFYLLTDPELFYQNTAKIIFKKNESLTIDEVNNYTERMNKAKVLFTGNDYEKYCKLVEKKYKDKLELGETIKLFEHMFKSIELPEFYNFKKYDLIYYGSNRTSDRQFSLMRYFHETRLNKLLIGVDKITFESTTSLAKVNHSTLLKHINSSKYNLCIADKAHNNNWITYRFLEGIVCNTVNMIDLNYDNRTLYKHDLLKQMCYVESIDDVYTKMQEIELYNLYDEIIRLQKIEFLRITA